jgi:hypothetical protein
LRVEFSQTQEAYLLWFRAQPLSGSAAAFTAGLRGQDLKTVLHQEIKQAQRLEKRQRLADAASHYRLAGEIDDIVTAQPPDEVKIRRRAEAASLTAQDKHAEAAAIYRQLAVHD